MEQLTVAAFTRLPADLARLDALDRGLEAGRPSPELPALDRAAWYLDSVRRAGTPLFAHLARAAFVASSLLRGLVEVGAVRGERIDALLSTTETVFGRLQADARCVREGAMTFDEFVARYGHLRPGTYDITSPCYAARPEEYLRPLIEHAVPANDRTFAWTDAERVAIETTLAPLGLPADADALERFVRDAVAGREAGKFVFTRPLSAALEAIAEHGASFGLGREELAHVRIGDLLLGRDALPDAAGFLARRVAEGRELHHVTQGVALPGQIATVEDLTCFEQERAQPNFVTQRAVQAEARAVGADGEVEGCIVLIPSADPGYDWLLARGIAGLITMFGGANSHMAVRAAEISLPAAIGVGEARFEELASARVLRLDCGARTITVVR